MKTVRVGMFETNSSSTHALSFCTEEQFQEWEKGNLYYYNDSFYNEEWIKENIEGIPDEDLSKIDRKLASEYNVYSYLAWVDTIDEKEGQVVFDQHWTTPKGEEIVAFGYYGYED